MSSLAQFCILHAEWETGDSCMDLSLTGGGGGGTTLRLESVSYRKGKIKYVVGHIVVLLWLNGNAFYCDVLEVPGWLPPVIVQYSQAAPWSSRGIQKIRCKIPQHIERIKSIYLTLRHSCHRLV